MYERYTIEKVGSFFEVFDWDKKETVFVSEGSREEAERVKESLNLDGLISDDPYGASLITE